MAEVQKKIESKSPRFRPDVLAVMEKLQAWLNAGFCGADVVVHVDQAGKVRGVHKSEYYDRQKLGLDIVKN